MQNTRFPQVKPETVKDEKEEELNKLKEFILYRLSEISWVHHHNPFLLEKKLRILKKEITEYKEKTIVLPSSLTLEGKIQRRILKRK